MRITKASLISHLKLFLKAMNLDASQYALDHNSVYGGYVIVKLHEDTSESHPFGAKRRTAKELADLLNFAILALGEKS